MCDELRNARESLARVDEDAAKPGAWREALESDEEDAVLIAELSSTTRVGSARAEAAAMNYT